MDEYRKAPLEVAYDDTDKAVDSLNAEKKLSAALKAKRRGDIFTESFSPQLVDDLAEPRCPKDPYQEQLLKDALKENILFRDLSQEELSQVLNAMTLKNVSANEVVIKQGESGDHFYIVESGLFSVFIDDVKVTEAKLGDGFGELALLYNCPRAATVKCKLDAVVWVLERHTFRSIIAGVSSRKKTEIKRALASVALLSTLNPEQLSKIADAVETANFKAGETIIRKGDKGNIFYMITKGRVMCTRAGTSNATDVKLKEGDYFGERALLKQEPRAANVIASVDTECLVLDRIDFNSLLGPLADVLNHNLGMRVIKSIPMLKGLSKAEIKKLMNALDETSYKPGDLIIKEGDNATSFYIIREGEATVTKSISATETSDVGSLSAGDFFGEGALLKDEPRGASVVARTSMVCLTLERTAFEKYLGPLQSIMAREAADRTNRNTEIVKLKARTSEEKVAIKLKLSDLKMLKTLGTGTFGRVKLVECSKTKQTYALKILQKTQVVAYRQQTNVVNEKNIMLEADHPFILRLYQTFKDKHRLYMLLEIVMGGELFSLLHLKGGALPNSDAQFYAGCVVDALEYLHSKQIVYRDLKPENLMIDDVGYIKVVDFGFAKKVLEKTYTLCGTPEYLAPELVLGKGHDKAVDNWAVGILIFEMLTGASPFADFDSNDHMVICKNIVRGKIDFPRKFSEKAKDLCSRLLARDPHTRLGSQSGGSGDIKAHAWFKNIDFSHLLQKEIKAPWIPEIKNATDTSNFDKYEEDDYVEPYKDDGSNWEIDF